MPSREWASGVQAAWVAGAGVWATLEAVIQAAAIPVADIPVAGGYPGGGGGGNYPGGGGRGSGGTGTDGINLPSSATVRWESAKPVQQAEARLIALHASYDSRPSETQADAKPEAKPSSDHYVVSLLGIRVPNTGRRDDDDNSGKITNTRAYDQFMSTTQLVIKNKTPISPDKVKFLDDRGQSEIQFLFPENEPHHTRRQGSHFRNDDRTNEGGKQVQSEENDAKW